MSITRTAWTDDSGAGTDGTIINNAAKTTLYDELDARWSELTTTSTGNQDNFVITSASIEADVLRCNNASLLTLRGIAAPASPAKPGKKLIIVSVGAGQVDLSNQDTNSTAANRIITGHTNAATKISLAAGSGRALLEYDDTTDRWRVVVHEQGAAIAVTHANSNFTGAGTDADWDVAAGDQTTFTYRLRQRQLHIECTVVSSTVANTPADLRVTIPGGFTAANTVSSACYASDNGTVLMTRCYVEAAGTVIKIDRVGAATWANATNATSVQFSFDFEVQ